MKTLRNTFKSVVLAFVVITSLTAFKAYTNANIPVEKIYTQTDRPFYFPGERLWFKSYVVTENNTISSLSDIAHAELISPKGTVVSSLKLAIKDGYAYGDFDIGFDWVGGTYTLKVYTNWMRNFEEEMFFTKKIIVQKIVKPNLLLNLDFKNDGYGKNAEVIAHFEAKDLKNNPLKNTQITYNVTVKGRNFITQKTVTNSDGKVNPKFTLPKDLSTTDVVLNVLIPYNGTTESISRSIPIVLDTIDLQFFPESGQIIAGTDNTIAFKAIDEFAKPIDVSGDIVNGKGQVVTTFSSFHDGMGRLTISAEKGENYVAKFKKPFVSDRVIRLPKVQHEGTIFSVNTTDKQAEIVLFSTEEEQLNLEISSASELLLQKKITPNNKAVKVNTEDFPMGITKFSIKNRSGKIVAERLVFINAHKQLHIDIDLDKTIYQTREKAKLTLTTTDFEGNPLPSNVSVSVADNKLINFADDKQDHMLSYLLLSSELKGKIHEPSFYFNPKEEKSLEALDYLMLTHGWRSYRNLTFENAQFLPEQHAIQSGTVVDENGNPITAHLLLMDQLGNQVLVFDTNEDGTFTFKFGNSRNLILLAYRDDKKNVEIKKTNFTNGRFEHHNDVIYEENKDGFKAFEKNEKLLKKKIKKKGMLANIALDEDEDALDEVVIEAYRTSTQKNRLGAITVIHSKTINNTQSISQLLQGQVSGLAITTGSGSPGADATINLRGVTGISGNSDPLIIVDGVPVDESAIKHINTSQIKYVSVLKDAAATALYGSRGSNGVVVISTKNNYSVNNYKKKKLNNAKFNNYAIQKFRNNQPSNTYSAQQFYIPKYEGDNLPEERTDFRQTIYWNPVVQTDENGKAELEFYNSDAITSFIVTSEGVSFKGDIGSQNNTYATKKLLNVDFKSPNYMALKDEVILPITVINETDETLKATLEIILPEHLKFVDGYDNKVCIDAHGSIIKNISVIPIKKAKNATIEVQVNSKYLSDVIKKEVTIISPYFPTETSISGTTSEAFEFELNSVVDGSLTAEFNIYTDVIGEVMNGIESLIRQPYGCFEQTSSSTYPNIMVLKYLKEAGKSNPEIEAKALDFIEKGYKRLISFETKENGFEWFGKTPPHETLTAYGVLEFTEMKDVYDGVDQAMIDRTVQWLMSRKDGKGGFKKSKKGYDSFASSPSDVANAYIVYAISEAQINVDLRLEYETAFNDALKSKDTYKMAMMVLASYNLKKPKNAAQLLATIKNHISEYNFNELPVENTITRSYGNAKNIETTAFTLLALMRETNPDEALIAKGIEYLVSQKQSNRFGSTQSTAMALKALITYTRTQKQNIINANDTFELVINGHSLKRQLEVSADGKITIHNLIPYFKKGKQHIEMKFGDEKKTFPYDLVVNWDSYVPDTSTKSPLGLETNIQANNHKVGDNISMSIIVSNKKDEPLGMVTSIIGIPSGTTAQPWQLKDILEQEQAAYYEVFDNYIVFYWRSLKPLETKTIRLDLKADIAGQYQAPASTAYLYYGDEFKTWLKGNAINISN